MGRCHGLGQLVNNCITISLKVGQGHTGSDCVGSASGLDPHPGGVGTHWKAYAHAKMAMVLFFPLLRSPHIFIFSIPPSLRISNDMALDFTSVSQLIIQFLDDQRASIHETIWTKIETSQLRGHPGVQKHCRATRTILIIQMCYVGNRKRSTYGPAGQWSPSSPTRWQMKLICSILAIHHYISPIYFESLETIDIIQNLENLENFFKNLTWSWWWKYCFVGPNSTSYPPLKLETFTIKVKNV